MSHWKHNLTATKVRGRWIGTCSCGWTSEKLDTVGQVTESYNRHTKLVEKEGRKASEDA